MKEGFTLNWASLIFFKGKLFSKILVVGETEKSHGTER